MPSIAFRGSSIFRCRLGVLQSARLAECLANEPIDAVYSRAVARVADGRTIGCATRSRSDRRAETARAIFGIFEGLTLDEAAERYPPEFKKWRERDPAWRPEGGESGQQLIDRVLSAVSDIGIKHPSQTVVLVSHGGVLDVLYRAARLLEWHAPREHQMLNAAINRLTTSATPLQLSIERWGDVAHLQESRDELPVACSSRRCLHWHNFVAI